MRDYVKRLVIVMAMGVCIGILIIGGRLAYAKTINGTEGKHMLGFDERQQGMEEERGTVP